VNAGTRTAACLAAGVVVAGLSGTALSAQTPQTNTGGASSTQRSATAAGPEFVDAQLQTRTSSGSLARDIEAIGGTSANAWITYRVAIADGPRSTCGGRSNMSRRLQLEPARSLNVLIRLEERRLVRVETATPDCIVDAGGLPVVDLAGVTGAESVRWLVSQIEASPAARNQPWPEQALAALSWHEGADAGRELTRLARSAPSPQMRSRALFWLAHRAENEAAGVVKDAVDNDPDIGVKRKAVFALTQLPPDRGVPLLIDVARTSSNREVRRQAMFWLGQSNDARAVSFFEGILNAK
jgi:hypothetical protein